MSEGEKPSGPAEEMFAQFDAQLDEPVCSWPGCPGRAEFLFRCRVCGGWLDGALLCTPHVKVYARAKGTSFGDPLVLTLECGGVGRFAALFVAESIESASKGASS